MIKNIIFDLGNVMLNYEPKEYLRQKIGEDKLSQVNEAVFRSREWIMLDEGTITQDEAVKAIQDRNPEIKDLIKTAFDRWYEMLTPIDETVEMMREFKKQGYKVYFLSNFHALAFDYVYKEYGFFKEFDGGVVSFKEKLLKPDRRIYSLLMERYSLKADECMLIDDTSANIDGAQNCGMHGVVFTTPESTLDRLCRYHISIPELS